VNLTYLAITGAIVLATMLVYALLSWRRAPQPPPPESQPSAAPAEPAPHAQRRVAQASGEPHPDRV
jgi:hypothetical protein